MKIISLILVPIFLLAGCSSSNNDATASQPSTVVVSADGDGTDALQSDATTSGTPTGTVDQPSGTGTDVDAGTTTHSGDAVDTSTDSNSGDTAGTGSDTNSGDGADTGTNTNTDNATDAGTDTDNATDAGTDTNTDNASDTGTGTNTDSDNDTDADANSGDATDSNAIDEQADTTITANINADNYVALLIQAFEIYSGRAYDHRLNRAEYVNSLDPITCESGSVDDSRANQYTFNDCVLNGEKISGSIQRDLNLDSAELSFSNFQSDIGGAGEMQMDGVIKRRCCSTYTEFNATSVDYEFRYADGHLKIVDAATYKTNKNNLSMMGGSFSMRSDALGDTTVAVSIINEFQKQLNSEQSDEAKYAFDTGSMKLSADDGSVLNLSVDSADATNAQVTIENAKGVQALTVPWSQFKDALSWSAPVEVQTLHRNAGDILNKLAGDDVLELSNAVATHVEKAIQSASSMNLGEAVISSDTSTDNVPTTNTTTQSTYQCSGGGSMMVTVINVSYAENDGFFNLNGSSDTTSYQMSDCIIPDPKTAQFTLTLNGSYETIQTFRGGRKFEISSSSSRFASFQQTRLSTDGSSTRYFVDAEYKTVSSVDDSQEGTSRIVSIVDYEFISDEGVSEAVEAAEFSQSQSISGLYTLNTVNFNVKGSYTGPLSDQYKVDIVTVSDFQAAHVLPQPPFPQDKYVAPNGKLVLTSANGDSLDIEFLSSDRIAGAYTARFESRQTDRASPLKVELPFYRYTNDNKGFSAYSK